MTAQILLEDLKEYYILKKAKKDVEEKMKRLQDKIRHQTMGQATTKIGRYFVYWGTVNTRTIKIARAKELLSPTMLNKVIFSSTCNKFTVGYK